MQFKDLKVGDFFKCGSHSKQGRVWKKTPTYVISATLNLLKGDGYVSGQVIRNCSWVDDRAPDVEFLSHVDPETEVSVIPTPE